MPGSKSVQKYKHYSFLGQPEFAWPVQKNPQGKYF